MPHLLLPDPITFLPKGAFVFPPTWAAFHWSGAEQIVFAYPEGKIIVQSMTVNGFVFAYLIASMHTPISLPCSSLTASGILHILINGQALKFHPGVKAGILYCPTKHYVLGYHPSLSDTMVNIGAGETHWLQIAFSTHFYQLLVQPLSLPAEYQDPFPQKTLFTTALPVYKRVSDTVRKLVTTATRSAPDVLQLHGLILQITASFTQAHEQKAQYDKWMQVSRITIAELEAYLASFLDTDHRSVIQPKQLAKLTGMTMHHFRQRFHAQYGMHIEAFIRKLRMEKAAQLLQDPVLTPSVIYLQVGYEDFSSFTRAFKRYFGYPPSRYQPPSGKKKS